MKDITKNPAFIIKVWDSGEKIKLDTNAIEWRPTECHVKLDGSVTNRPSFTFVLWHPQVERRLFAQVTLDMMLPAIRAATQALVPELPRC